MPVLYTSVSTDFYLGHVKFFRSRLLTLDTENIVKLIDGMEKEAMSIRSEVLKLCWYMRGGLSYSEGMNLSSREREIVNAIVKENLETTKKSGLPFF
jgi:hypothetical protein